MLYDVASLTAVNETVAPLVVILLMLMPVGVLQGVKVVKLVEAV
jgi:hypothetical protein